jgi:hypothetical protein
MCIDQTMLRKLTAGLLVVLTALPFTAPFAIVDIPTLLGAQSSTLPQQTSLAPSVDDSSHALVASTSSIRTRIRTVLQMETDISTRHAASPALDAADTPPLAAFPLADRTSLTALRI